MPLFVLLKREVILTSSKLVQAGAVQVTLDGFHAISLGTAVDKGSS